MSVEAKLTISCLKLNLNPLHRYLKTQRNDRHKTTYASFLISGSSNLRPMYLLVAYNVFSGFVTA